MLPRTTRQAILLFGGLILLAVALHMGFCRWDVKEPVGQVGTVNHARLPLLTYTHEVLTTMPFTDPATGATVNRPRGWTMSGLFARHSLESGKALGVIAPLVVLGLTLYLFLVWRHEDRHRKGKCTACGHQITPDTDKKRCPECGEFAE